MASLKVLQAARLGNVNKKQSDREGLGKGRTGNRQNVYEDFLALSQDSEVLVQVISNKEGNSLT